MCVIDGNALDYNRLTPEEWDRLRRQAVHRAHVARARALRDVIGGGVRALRAAAIGALLGAAAEAAVTTARKWWRAYTLRRERKAAVRELRALDDRTLRDIGVNRSEIDWVVYGRDETRLRDLEPLAPARRAQRHDRAVAANEQAPDQEERRLAWRARYPTVSSNVARNGCAG